MVEPKPRYAFLKQNVACGSTSVEWDRFISVIILVVKAGWPDCTNRIRKGRAMPILIWIATIACMMEIAMGYAPDRSHKDLPARSDQDLDQ
jgi:hypothetical protein